MAAVVAMALGVGAGLAVVGLDLLPERDSVGSIATPADSPPPSCPDGRSALRIAAAPEIAPALDDLAADASQTEEALRCVDVQVVSAPPVEIRDALSRGWAESGDGPPPHVWVPTTSTEVALTGETSAASGMFRDDNPSIVGSPTVIAMPRPMAQALGWPDFDLTWNDVAKLVAADNAWESRSDEDWGPFRLSLVEDVQSQPSMDAVMALARTTGVQPPDPSASEETSAEQFEARAQLLLLERKVEYLGTSTQAQLDELRLADTRGELMDQVSALPLTEQQVLQYNRGTQPDGDASESADGSEPAGGPASEPRTPLAAWYPSDGGPDADYPYAVLSAPWSDRATDLAAGAFLDLVQSEEGLEGLREAGFRDDTRRATLELNDASSVRPDRAPPEPQPFDVAVMPPLLRTWRALSQTGNILGVIDVSGSMATEVPGTGATRLELSAQGAMAGLQLFNPQSIAGLWEFSTNIGPNGEDHRELIPLGPLEADVGGVTGREAAIAALQQLRPREDTGLYDTIAAAYEHMLEHYQPGRINAVIVFTDGKNDDDGLSLEQLQARLRELVDPERRVAVLAVGYGPEADFEALNAITAVTDGKIYSLDRPEDIRNVFIDVQTGGVR